MLSRRNQKATLLIQMSTVYHDDWPSSYKHGDSSYLLDGAESRKWPKLKFNFFKPDPTPSKNTEKARSQFFKSPDI